MTGTNPYFSNISTTMEHEDNRIRLLISVAPGYEVSEEYFLISRGIMKSMPGLLGYPPATS